MVQEVNNKAHRWLLPFTSGVDLPTIEAALRITESAEATLIAVSFVVTLPEWRSQAVRLELIEQSKDFLEACHYKALKLSIPVECYEVYTSEVVESIAVEIRALGCESLVLASRDQQPLLLHEAEVQQLLLEPPAALVFIRFSQRFTQNPWPEAKIHPLSWIHRVSYIQRHGCLSASTALEREQSQPQVLSAEPSSLVFVRGRTAGKEADLLRRKEG